MHILKSAILLSLICRKNSTGTDPTGCGQNPCFLMRMFHSQFIGLDKGMGIWCRCRREGGSNLGGVLA